MTTYSISLDDVDLALMPLYTSYNNFLRKEHFKFEVKKTVTFEVPEPSTLYTCHICAIVMPAAFAREHATSVKHRANARIASIAAQRLCALVSALPPPSTALTARFCANCATVADDDHYKTREHRDAVAHDNLLWDLMKAYAQKSPDDDPKYDQDCSNNQRSSNNRMDKNNDHEKDLEFKNDGNNTNNNSMAAQAIHRNQPTESIKEKQHKPIEEQHIAKNCEINNNLKEHNDDHKTDDINDSISTSNTTSTEVNVTVVEVKSDILIDYPYEVTATGHTYCVVCKCKVPGNAHNREEHVKGSKHCKRVISQSQPTQPIKDEKEEQTEENGIDDNLEEYSEDKEFSDDNNSMGSNLYEANDEDVIDESQIEYPSEVTATGLDCEVPNFERSRNEHVQGRTHRNMMNRENESIYEEEEHIAEDCETNESFDEYSEDKKFDNNDNNNTRTDIQYPFKVTATGVDCVVCNCHVPNHEHNRIEHIRGWRHRNRNMVISQSQPTQPIKDEKEEQTEENGIDDNLEEYSEDEESSDDNNSMGSNLYEANDEDVIDESQIEYPSEVTATGLDCEVPNFERSRNEHVQGRTHRNMMNRENESIYEKEEHMAEDCETNESFEEYSEDKEFYNNDNNNTRTDIQYPFKVTATGVDCVVCNCHVPNHEHNRIEHIRGWRHRNRNMISQIEHPFKVTATGQHCMVCDCQVPNHEQSRNEHIQGCRHRNMMNRANGSIDEEEEQIAEACETNDSIEEYSEHEEFDNNDHENSSSITAHPFEVTATGHVECVVCDCKILDNVHNREEHINGMRHRSMVMNQPEEEEQSPDNSEICESSEHSEDEQLTDDNSDI